MNHVLYMSHILDMKNINHSIYESYPWYKSYSLYESCSGYEQCISRVYMVRATLQVSETAGCWILGKHHHGHGCSYGHRADEAAESNAAESRAHVHSNHEALPRRLDVLWGRGDVTQYVMPSTSSLITTWYCCCILERSYSLRDICRRRSLALEWRLCSASTLTSLACRDLACSSPPPGERQVDEF